MSISNEIENLSALHQRGALSDEEFARAKARVIGGAGRDHREPALAAINSLRRSRSDRWLGGVCGGLAEMSGLAAWLWRLMFTLLVLCAGTGALVYLLMWIFLPIEDSPGISSSAPVHAG